MISPTHLVIGASSGIAQAYIEQTLAEPNTFVVGISRGAIPKPFQHWIASDRLNWIWSDYCLDSMHGLANTLGPRLSGLRNLVICNGLLHQDSIQPEKQLKQLDERAFQHLMRVNALLPMLWIQQLVPHLGHQQSATITVFSARVGSIEDNHLGGWYSYRASKASLNMLLKSYSVELSRTYPNMGILIFHPGTTDTELSKPFQNNVPEDKLFSPDFVAKQLIKLQSRPKTLCPIQYLDWQGKSIPW